MPIQGVKCLCQPEGGSFEKAIECLKSGRGKALGCHHSFLAIESMSQEFGKDRPNTVSVTETQKGDWGCHRSVYIQRKFPFFISPDNSYRPWKGIVFHSILKSVGQKDSIKEMRIEKTFRFNEKNYALSGQFDCYDTRYKTLVDLKEVKAIVEKWLPYEHHIEQTNLYAHLIRSIGLEVRKIECHYFDSEKSKVVDIPMWSEEGCLKYIEEHLPPLADALDSQTLPPYKKIMKCSRCDVIDKCHEFLSAGV